VKITFKAALLSMTVLLTNVACSPADDGAQNSATTTEPATSAPAAMPRTASAEGASVFIVSPADGDTVSSPFTVEFGIGTMAVVRAGDNTPNTGHHHILIDTGLPPLDRPIPADEHHVHVGDGSSATELTLAPGEHTLQLLLGDHLHIPHDPPVYSARITVIVE